MKKVIICFSCFLFLAAQSNGQAFQWAKQFASTYSVASDVVTDNSLNVISAGWFNDSVDLDPGPATNWVYTSNLSASNNAYLCKLDQNGSFQWGYSFDNQGQSSFNRIYAIDVDNQNNIIVSGQFRDSIDLDFLAGTFKLYDTTPNVNNSTWENMFVAKYDPNGNLLWGKGFSSSSVTSSFGIWGAGLKVDANNNVLLSGHFRDTVDFDPGLGVYNLVGTYVNTTYYGNKFLLKLSAAGNFVWVRDWDQTGNWNNNSLWGGNELDVDASNNIFFPIIFIDSFDADPLTPVSKAYSNGFRDVSLLKVSPSGSLVWHKEVGGPANDYCSSLATDPSGNIFYSVQILGNTPVDFDPGPGTYLLNWTTNNWGKAILKLDNNGNFIWALKNLDNSLNTGWFGEGMATDTSGGLYLTTRIHSAWSTNSFDLDPGPNAYLVSSKGFYDIAFQNLDGNGNFVWGGVMGGTQNDWAIDVCTDHLKGVYVSGYFWGAADFDPTPDTSQLISTPLSADAFVVKLNNCNVTESTIYQACDSVVFNNQVFYNDTIMQSHYPAFNGCDSAHSIVIDVKALTNDTIHVDTCKFYNWNTTSYTSSGFYTHNYGLPGGCDSMVTLDLTIDLDTIQFIQLSSCDSAVFNGVTYYQSGDYQQQYNSSTGCDSNFLVNFVRGVGDTTLAILGMNSLMANAPNAIYQWIDCNTLAPVAGATAQTFLATLPGSYACVITKNGCTDTSACYNLNFIPNAVTDYSTSFNLYPNPSKGTYHLALDKMYQDVHLEIRTLSGQLVWEKDFKRLKETNLNIDNAPGVYMLYIKSEEQQHVKKLLKW